MLADNLFLGRQPILDRDRNLVAFELLFRSSQENSFGSSDGFLASATVITHVFNELGVDQALGDCLGFINVDEALLMSDVIEFVPKSQVVLEILETVPLNSDVIARCRHLKSMGFTLALDDLTEYRGDTESVMEHIDIVKIDISVLDSAELGQLVAKLRKWPVKLLAEKVETFEEFRCCLEHGFHLFQGYHFAKPQIINGKRMSHSEMVLLRLLEKLNGDADIREIEDILKEDPLLSYNLLRIVNSAAIAAREKVASLNRAVALLGRRQLQRWAQLLLYTSSGAPYPNPLLQLAATRGKIMELLSPKTCGPDSEENAFMTGIMSLLDALLGMPFDEILALIEIDQEVKAALTGHDGALGNLLRLVKTMEGHEEPHAGDVLESFPGMTLHELNVAQSAALAWVSGLRES